MTKIVTEPSKRRRFSFSVALFHEVGLARYWMQISQEKCTGCSSTKSPGLNLNKIAILLCSCDHCTTSGPCWAHLLMLKQQMSCKIYLRQDICYKLKVIRCGMWYNCAVVSWLASNHVEANIWAPGALCKGKSVTRLHCPGTMNLCRAAGRTALCSPGQI